MKNLNELFDYAMWVVEECGIETGDITNVTINTRAKKRYGQCRQTGNKYMINISAFILSDDTKEDAVMETIIHEILHTCKGCMNHGREWKGLPTLCIRRRDIRLPQHRQERSLVFLKKMKMLQNTCLSVKSVDR